MLQENRKKTWWGAAKETAVHHRVAEVPNHTSWALNNLEALQYLNQREASATASPQVEENHTQADSLTEDEIERLAFFDVQTAAYNFRYAMRKLRRELDRCKRYKRPVSLCVISVDGLKRMWQEHDAAVADEATQAAASALIHMIRADVDMVGRYGDCHFVLILPETSGHGASVLAERIRKKFETIEIKHQWYVLKIGTSIGISHFPGHGNSAEELIAYADLASEIAEQRGGNRFYFAPEENEGFLD